VYQARYIVESWQDIQWDNAAIDLHDKKRAYFDGVLSLKASIDTLSNAEMMVCCSVVQCMAVHCSVWQCVAVCCSDSSVLQCVKASIDTLSNAEIVVCCSVLQHVALYCSVHTAAVCGSVLQCTLLQCIAVCCSVLQCVAVYCSVLQ